MPILNFPASPNNGDTFTQNNIQWQYNSVYGVWDVISAGPTGFTGSQGFTGSVGFTGSRGDTGFIGSRGISIDIPSDDTTTNATYYPIVAIDTSNTTIRTSSTKLTFNPSTGTLTATSFSGNGANITSVPASPDEFARTFAILGY
jgi:hypothetical protein